MGIAVAIHFDLPFLITAVVAGFLISNFHTSALFDSLKLKDMMPLFNLLFFAIIGASVRIESFSRSSILLVIGYIVLRATGKLVGNWVGCKMTKQDSKITASLPKLMLPKAGMAAVETILVAKLLVGSGGMLIFNTIIPALVFFELFGAYLSEKTLLKWKSWTTGEKGGNMAVLDINWLFDNRIMCMKPTSVSDCIDSLTDVLKNHGITNDISIIKNALYEREKLGSSVIGDRIAIPHCRSEVVDRVFGICAFLDELIPWDAAKTKVDTVYSSHIPTE